MLALLVASAIVTAACNADEQTATTASSTTTAMAAAETSTTTTAVPTVPAPTRDGFRVYFLRDCPDGDRDASTCRVAVGELRTTDGDDVARAALDAVLAGPNDAEQAAGLSTNVDPRTVVNSFSVTDGVATVDVIRSFETANTQPQVAQVVYTLTQFPEIRAVQFLIDGETNGATGVPPVGRDAYTGWAPAVLVETPTLNAFAPTELVVAGTVAADVTRLSWSVLGPDGSVVSTGTADAAASPPDTGGARRPFGFAATTGATGPATLVLTAEVPAGSASWPLETRVPLLLG
ncbi:MAG: GerMN domain-containing protein [Acidimicrobiales bacterium]|nr:GerMN domain-containing protein [Acidimicrobiales bacterium]